MVKSIQGKDSYASRPGCNTFMKLAFPVSFITYHPFSFACLKSALINAEVFGVLSRSLTSAPTHYQAIERISLDCVNRFGVEP